MEITIVEKIETERCGHNGDYTNRTARYFSIEDVACAYFNEQYEKAKDEYGADNVEYDGDSFIIDNEDIHIECNLFYGNLE